MPLLGFSSALRQHTASIWVQCRPKSASSCPPFYVGLNTRTAHAHTRVHARDEKHFQTLPRTHSTSYTVPDSGISRVGSLATLRPCDPIVERAQSFTDPPKLVNTAVGACLGQCEGLNKGLLCAFAAKDHPDWCRATPTDTYNAELNGAPFCQLEGVDCEAITAIPSSTVPTTSSTTTELPVTPTTSEVPPPPPPTTTTSTSSTEVLPTFPSTTTQAPPPPPTTTSQALPTFPPTTTEATTPPPPPPTTTTTTEPIFPPLTTTTSTTEALSPPPTTSAAPPPPPPTPTTTTN